MSADDKYPPESGRRRFVKGVVGSATLSAVGTGAAAAVNTATASPGAGGGPTQFFAVENTSGPAPRGMPQIPLNINSSGEIEGVWPENVEDGIATMELGGVQYQSSWFQYCGVQTYEGVRPDADQDNVIRSAASAPYEWQADQESGTPLTVDMFEDYQTWTNINDRELGKPAIGNWRSQDVSPSETMPVQVLRSPRIQDMRENPGGYDIDNVDWFMATTTEEGFVGWLDKCTHFCCVPAFKAYEGSAKFGGEDGVYCQCHQSVYDPFSLVQKQFVALPRPEE